jgi:hypothetical protein
MQRLLEAEVGRSQQILQLRQSGILHIATSSHLADDIDPFRGDINLVIGGTVRAITASRLEAVTVATAIAGG